MRTAIVSLGCVLAAAACAGRSAPPAGTSPPPPPAPDATFSGWERLTLTGVGREEPEGRPLAGVIVRVQGSATGVVTDRTGTYRIQGLEGGSYTVEAVRVGFYPERREISFGAHSICTQCRETAGDERVLHFWMRRADQLLSARTPGRTGHPPSPASKNRKAGTGTPHRPGHPGEIVTIRRFPPFVGL